MGQFQNMFWLPEDYLNGTYFFIYVIMFRWFWLAEQVNHLNTSMSSSFRERERWKDTKADTVVRSEIYCQSDNTRLSQEWETVYRGRQEITSYIALGHCWRDHTVNSTHNSLAVVRQEKPPSCSILSAARREAATENTWKWNPHIASLPSLRDRHRKV